jgi:predicted ester cyclase
MQRQKNDSAILRRNIVSEDPNKKVFERVIEQAYNKGNVDVLNEAFAPNFVEHQAGIVPPKAEGVKRSIAFLRGAFPDLELTIEEIITNGDKTWARITGRGTHQGPFMGLPPSGRAFTITVMDVCRFENGQIVEHWGVADQLSVMAQIGALPSLPQLRP